jgi:hemerythrin-like domain-containing protein
MMPDLFQPTPTFDDPLAMLRACHRRMESAIESVQRLPELERRGPLDPGARTALRQTLQYFAVVVPRHLADEEESLFPRMLAVEGHGPAAEVIAGLREEHAGIRRMHGELARLGDELVRAGQLPAPELRERLNATVRELAHAWREHLRVEEEIVFPRVASTIPPGEFGAIGAEMASRRGIAWPFRGEPERVFRAAR